MAGNVMQYYRRKFFQSTNIDYNLASLVFSPFRLINSYTGNCWKIRRVSDSSLLDIGFDNNGYIDINAISTFLGSGQGRLNTYYNQKGVNNFISESSSREPLIYDNGIVTGLEGITGIDFEGPVIKNLRLQNTVNVNSAAGCLFLIVIERLNVNSIQALFSNRLVNINFRSSSENNINWSGVNSPGTGISIISPKKIVGFAFLNETDNYVFDEFEESNLALSYNGNPIYMDLLGARQNLAEIYHGKIHEIILFQDINVIDKNLLINQRKAVYNP